MAKPSSRIQNILVPVFQIREILVRFRIRGPVPLPNGSGSGSSSFRQ
jgi:hypothetical protein